MKKRNFISIGYQNEKNRLFQNKFSLKSTYQDFYPQKTYSKRMHHNNKILNLKSDLASNIISPLKKDNNKNKTISTPQSNPISNNNTCYKTNGFSPHSTRTIFSQIKVIKEKSIRKKISKKNKALLSMKYIEFIKDNNLYNNKNNHFIKLIKKNHILNNIIIDDDTKNIPKNINKEKIKNIFIGEKEHFKNKEINKVNNKANELINQIEKNCKINKNINSFFYPNIKLNEGHNKGNDKRKRKSKNKNNLEIDNLFFESSKDTQIFLMNLEVIRLVLLEMLKEIRV